nr:benzoate/H(+) symporter BenE family transporter [Alphaproteobacteria bacterium]
MLRDISAQAVFMGFLTAFAGFTSSFAVVLQGLAAVGASEAQAASGLMALAIAMGLGGIILSAATRAPVSVAWSTPGAALLASTGAIDGGFAAVVGAFLVCGFGFILAGLWKPLGRAIGAIPAPLANAMLAGILVSLCLAPFKAIAFDPLLGLPIL